MLRSSEPFARAVHQLFCNFQNLFNVPRVPDPLWPSITTFAFMRRALRSRLVSELQYLIKQV